MSDNPYEIGNVEYWMDGNIERFDPNSLAFKKTVYGSYSRTSIMSDKDSQKSGIQLILNPNDTTISKADAQREENNINDFEGYFGSQFGKSGTWSSRNTRQQKAQAYRRLEDIDNRKNIINSILLNPVNIQRWANEERLIQKQEDEKLLQIQLEEKKIQDEIKRKEFARLKILKDIEDKRLQELAIIEAPKRAALQAARIEKIKQNDFQRLVETELQKILNPVIEPTITSKITPEIVATSSLIPLGIIALLLYTRTGRK